ncbi:sphingolipid delta(4)-desaturase family protein Ecym_2648 [Eremothecium cymbalariae DBVPG|uniref:sphingolipid 4-desaturase n=1 Tax=Eremothecium cymbalariae (strain CBS 270.75 / DBVPG 7215 / KCTC 17166 / NRRL Y-17582) TaxID=931890 RepID=G8JNT4_ERECY|nr:Hypothetical protein Ecym_2648 [Eremothecium cymbalariae DBVPG\
MSINHKNLVVELKDVDPPSAYDDINVLHNFYWTSQKEPHAIRRHAILRDHPEVKKLMGHEPRTKYIVIGVVLLQLWSSYMLCETHPLTLKFVLWSYIIGATCNQSIFLAIHELSHNLGFKRCIHNRFFAIFTNTPIGIPFAASFGPYHQLHHKFLGDEVYDTDIPTKLEAVFLSNILGKAFFATFQILFYALRPMFVTSIPFTQIHLLNVAYQLLFNTIWISNFGWYSFFYFIMSSFLAGSLHPCSGHFIAEHYVFSLEEAITGGKVALTDVKGDLQTTSVIDEKAVERPDVTFTKDYALETYSYYGILNMFTWNVGLHNEHHDFPFIAWSKLWDLNRMCPEYYNSLPRHNSWVGVLWDFIFKHDVTLYNRVKRVNKSMITTHIS